MIAQLKGSPFLSTAAHAIRLSSLHDTHMHKCMKEFSMDLLTDGRDIFQVVKHPRSPKHLEGAKNKQG